MSCKVLNHIVTLPFFRLYSNFCQALLHVWSSSYLGADQMLTSSIEMRQIAPQMANGLGWTTLLFQNVKLSPKLKFMQILVPPHRGHKPCKLSRGKADINQQQKKRSWQNIEEKKMKEVASGWKKWIRMRSDKSMYHLAEIHVITWRNTCNNSEKYM